MILLFISFNPFGIGREHNVAKDFKDRNILIFQNDWGINWALEHNKGLILSGVGKSDE